MFTKKIFLSLLACFLLVTGARSNTGAQDLSKYQAVFITKFIDYVNWPSGNDKLVIGVVGNSRLLLELQSSVKAKGKNVTVKKINGADDATRCNIVFLPAGENRLFSTILEATKGKSVLLITETEALAKQGSVITFYTEGGKLKFIVNKGAAASRKLQISGRLLTLAKVI